jgi:hypothetical protein
VNFIILEGGVSRLVSATTVDGVARITLSSSQLNSFIPVTAEVANSDLNATTSVYSTDNFASVFQIVSASKALLIDNNTVYQQGSQFALFIRNLSNRDFEVITYLVKNGGVNFHDSPVTDAIYLSDGLFEGGEYTVAGYQLDEDTPDNTISIEYIMKNPVTLKGFGFWVNFNRP